MNIRNMSSSHFYTELSLEKLEKYEVDNTLWYSYVESAIAMEEFKKTSPSI